MILAQRVTDGGTPSDASDPALPEDASRTHDYSVAKNATVRAARPDPSLRKSGLLRIRMELISQRWESGLVLDAFALDDGIDEIRGNIV